MPTILCFGDSNTYGYDQATRRRLPTDVRWPGILRCELGPDFEILEEGLNGRTTAWDDPFAEGRNGKTHLLPCLHSHAPVDLVVLMLGSNDLKAIFRVSAPEVASGAAALVTIVQSSGAGTDGRPPQVLLVVPPPVDPGRGHSELWGFGQAASESRRLPQLYSAVAEEANCALLDSGTIVSTSLLDGVHLDPSGHAQLWRAMAEQVRQLLGPR